MHKHKGTETCATPTRCTDCAVREKALFQVVADNYLNDAQSRRAAQYHLSARSHLYQENHPATMAYTLFDGWLMLYRTGADGSRQGLRVALPGDFVGYMAQAQAVYSHAALAVNDVIVCGFRQADLHAMINKQPDIAHKITAIQAEYLAICETSVLGLGRKTAEQRIAYTIVDLYQRLSQRGEVATHNMPFPLTQEMLGELTGLTPVHTNRVLRKLRRDNVMLCERQRVEIFDLPRLAEIAEYRGAVG